MRVVAFSKRGFGVIWRLWAFNSQSLRPLHSFESIEIERNTFWLYKLVPLICKFWFPCLIKVSLVREINVRLAVDSSPPPLVKAWSIPLNTCCYRTAITVGQAPSILVQTSYEGAIMLTSPFLHCHIKVHLKVSNKYDHLQKQFTVSEPRTMEGRMIFQTSRVLFPSVQVAPGSDCY